MLVSNSPEELLQADDVLVAESVDLARISKQIYLILSNHQKIFWKNVNFKCLPCCEPGGYPAGAPGG